MYLYFKIIKINTIYFTGCPINSKSLKELILNQSNKTKIRPVLLSLGGIPKSGKTKALSHLLKHYVDRNTVQPMTPVPMKEKFERAYYELVATGFYSQRNVTITEVPKESSCAFGILSALRNELMANGKVPLFNPQMEPLRNFEDDEFNENLHYMFHYLCEYEYTPKGNEVTNEKLEFMQYLNLILPEGIGLVNIWDIAFNKTVLHCLSSLRGLLYNSRMWLFLDMERDLENLDKPPEFLKEKSRAAASNRGRVDRSVLMKWRPRLHYLLLSSRMTESMDDGPRKCTCTIFAKHTGSCHELKQKVIELEDKVKQVSKLIGVSSLIEPKIEVIDIKDSGISGDSSRHLFQKLQQVIDGTPYEDVPLSWVFLRSLFYRSKKIFISKLELKTKAKECGMDDDSLTKFCKFYTSFGSIFDLSLISPEYLYVIVKPIRFLTSLDGLLHAEDSICRQYPTLVNGIIPQKACEKLLGENWSVFMEALVSVSLATRVSSSQLDIVNLDSDHAYYYVPLSHKGDLIMEADPTAVHLITSINTPHVFKQATFAKYVLESLPESKLVPCNNVNETIIKECSTGTIITLVSHSPAVKIFISKASPKVCSLIVKAYNEIAETCKIGTTKYKFVTVCAKSGFPNVQDIPSCQYHVLPNDTLCYDCVIAGRVNDQLKAWNKALKEVSSIIP